MCRSFSKNVRNIWQRVCSQEAGEGGCIQAAGCGHLTFRQSLLKTFFFGGGFNVKGSMSFFT